MLSKRTVQFSTISQNSQTNRSALFVSGTLKSNHTRDKHNSTYLWALTIHKQISTFCNRVLLTLLLLCLSSCAGLSSNYSDQKQIEFVPALEYNPRNEPRVHQPPYASLYNSYRQWLVDNAVAPNRINKLLADASPSIVHIVDLQNGDLPEMQFPSWFVAGGTIPAYGHAKSELPQPDTAHKTMPINFEQPSIKSALYIGHFFQKYECEIASGIGLNEQLTLEEYRHLHQFFLNEAIWTPHDYEIAEAALLHITSAGRAKKNARC